MAERQTEDSEKDSEEDSGEDSEKDSERRTWKHLESAFRDRQKAEIHSEKTKERERGDEIDRR